MFFYHILEPVNLRICSQRMNHLAGAHSWHTLSNMLMLKPCGQLMQPTP